MSMQLSTFTTFPGGKQVRKTPLNVLVKLFNQHAVAIFLMSKTTQTFMHCWILTLLGVFKEFNCL